MKLFTKANKLYSRSGFYYTIGCSGLIEDKDFISIKIINPHEMTRPKWLEDNNFFNLEDFKSENNEE